MGLNKLIVMTQRTRRTLIYHSMIEAILFFGPVLAGEGQEKGKIVLGATVSRLD